MIEMKRILHAKIFWWIGVLLVLLMLIILSVSISQRLSYNRRTQEALERVYAPVEYKAKEDVETREPPSEYRFEILYPTEDDLEEVRTLTGFTIHGTADPEADAITVTSTCRWIGERRLEGFSAEDWEWEYPVSVNKMNLCRGDHVYVFTAYKDYYLLHQWRKPSTDLGRKEIRITSDVGYATSGQLQSMGAVKKFMRGTHQPLEHDKSIAVPFEDLCGEKYSGQSSPVITPLTDDAGVSVRVMSKKWEDNSFDVPVLVFYEWDSEEWQERADVPPLEGRSCSSDVFVYYLRPDRIIVEEGPVIEWSSIAHIFDGEEWVRSYDFVRRHLDISEGYLAPLGVRMNKDVFSFKEGPYCCDLTESAYPQKWSEFIFDIETLSLVDIVLHEGGPRF